MTTKCTAAIGSVTAATKAGRALASASIYADIIKLSWGSRGKGCIYGIEFNCSQSEYVTAVLADAGIKIKDISPSEDFTGS